MSITTIRISVIAMALAMSAAWSDPASAANRRVKVINETNHTVVRFYGSNAGQDSWQEDVLGDDVLKPGQSVVVNFDDGSGYCKFDFLAKFDDGEQAESRGIDVCATEVFRLTGN